jgi:hypothetical protein
VRRWPMTDFRYTIFYRIDSNAEGIDVLRVMDAVVRFLLKPTPGHEGFAKGVFGNVQHLVPYEAYAAIAKPVEDKRLR